MNKSSFIKEKAKLSHNGSILAADVLPLGMNAPFSSAWGYLENNSKMEGHSHPTEEIYIVVKGEGIVVVGEEKERVRVGDVIEIPCNTEHTMFCDDKGPLLWAALWWEKKEIL